MATEEDGHLKRIEPYTSRYVVCDSDGEYDVVLDTGERLDILEAFLPDVGQDLMARLHHLLAMQTIRTELSWPSGVTFSHRGIGSRTDGKGIVVLQLADGQEFTSDIASRSACWDAVRMHSPNPVFLRWRLSVPQHGVLSMHLASISPLQSKNIVWHRGKKARILRALCAAWNIRPSPPVQPLLEALAHVIPPGAPSGADLPYHLVGYVPFVKAWRDAMGSRCFASMTALP